MVLALLKMYKLDSFLHNTFHTSACLQAKPERAMKKVMTGSSNSKKKKVYSDDAPIMPNPNTFSKGSHEGRYSGNSKRSTVLNKLFMRHITDLMATGENSSEFLGHGIEINRVQIAPDFKGLTVFWVARGTKDDDLVDDMLRRNSGYLRHELSSLRLMGNVPRIFFVKDKQYAKVVEVENRLARADFGDNHVPVELESKLKSQLELFTSLPSNVKDKIKEIDEEHLEYLEVEEEVLPQMPHDVLGLNHAEILNRVKKAMKKSEALHRLSSSVESDVTNENPVQYSRAAFKEFLVKRELARSKLRKMEKNYFPDIEYTKQELKEQSEMYFKNMGTFYEPEENDYIEDEIIEIENDDKIK